MLICIINIKLIGMHEAKKDQSSPIIIKQVKPLLYNFFIKDSPEQYQEAQYNQNALHSHRSETIDRKKHYFKPKLSCKKLTDDPMFLLTIEKKKMKVINGLSQRAVSEKPHRNFYRAGKLKTSASRTISVASETIMTERISKHKRIESQLKQKSDVVLKKIKPPNMQFNLKHLLQTTREFHERQESSLTKGNNLPYYSYYSSAKSPLPQSSRTQRVRRKRQIRIPDRMQLNLFQQ